MTRKQGTLACADAIRYLVAHQEPCGRWVDYRLPVGSSDEWMTGFVGFACVDAASRLPRAIASAALDASARAADWLTRHRAYEYGWGFNGVTGPDADSTAWALRLHAALRLVIRDGDVAFLLSHWIDGAGFATYRRPDAWGNPHPDVTPIAALALPPELRGRLRPAIIDVIMRSRRADGSWPSYWWRGCHYSTASNAELLARWEVAAGVPIRPDLVAIPTPYSSLDVACALSTACFFREAPQVRAQLADALQARQRDDGSWLGGEDLRVTDPGCHRPWLESAGRLYRDVNGLLTTAASLRAVALCAELEED